MRAPITIHGSAADERSSCMRFLDSTFSDDEFEKELEQKRFLQQCKRDKFKGLYKAGLLEKPEHTDASGPNVKRPYLKPEQKLAKVRAIAKRIREGERLEDIAKEMGYMRNTLTAWANAAGEPLPRTVRITEAKQDQVINLVNEHGYAMHTAVNFVGVSECGIRYQLKKRGLRYCKKAKKFVSNAA